MSAASSNPVPPENTGVQPASEAQAAGEGNVSPPPPPSSPPAPTPPPSPGTVEANGTTPAGPVAPPVVTGPTLSLEEKRKQLESEALPYMDLVYSVARRMVGDEARAEDLVQEAYLRAFRSVEQYTPGTNCKAWLLTILRSVYIDASRHVQARGGTHEQLPADVFAPNERSDLPIDAAKFMSILDIMVDDDIRDAMLQIPDLYREAFIMVVIAELPYKEAATVLSVQEGTVKSRVFRACQMLKGKLWKYAVERRIAKIDPNP